MSSQSETQPSNPNPTGGEPGQVSFTDEQQRALDRILTERLERQKRAAAAEREAAVKEALKQFEGVDLDGYKEWQAKKAKDDSSKKSESETFLEKKLADLEAKMAQVTEKERQANEALRQKLLEDHVRGEALKSGVDPKAIDDFLVLTGVRQAKPLFAWDDNAKEVVVFDPDGTKSVRTLGENLTGPLKKAMDRFYVAPNPTGGSGAQASSPVKNSKQINRQQFDKLSPAEQMKFIQGGGEVVD